MAAERVTNLYYKIIANQEASPPSIAGNVNTSSTSMGLHDMNKMSGVMATSDKWYGAAAQAAEEPAYGDSAGALSTNGDVDMGLGWAMDDMWAFTSSELFLL